MSLADGSVAFMGFGGPWFARGTYTDIGGTLNAIVDINANKMITVGGTTFEVSGLNVGPEALGKTPTGYSLVFFAVFGGGGQAIVRAVIS